MTTRVICSLDLPVGFYCGELVYRLHHPWRVLTPWSKTMAAPWEGKLEEQFCVIFMQDQKGPCMQGCTPGYIRFLDCWSIHISAPLELNNRTRAAVICANHRSLLFQP